jgi:hypothetical protein
MKKICFIIPFFGKLPNYFQLWLNSCKTNSAVTWIFFTDSNEIFNYPPNVIVNHITFDGFKEKIQKIFDFQLSIDSPYKLCDFKPAYGEIFEHELKDYQYWGYCDIDLIFGDIISMLDAVISRGYDKILTRGHFVLFKNNHLNNRKYRIHSNHYKEVFSSARHYAFDELTPGGVHEIFVKSDSYVFDEILFSDIYVGSFLLIPVQMMVRDGISQNSIFVWSSGKLFRLYFKNSKIISEEILYVHLQKRSMGASEILNNADNFLVVPNEFRPLNNPIDDLDSFRIYFKLPRPYFAYYIIRLKNLLKRFRSKVKFSIQ